jgi:hypothetical protein
LDPLISELLSSSDLEAEFTLNDTERCVFTDFQIYSEVNGTLISDVDDLYTVLDLANRATNLSALDVNTTVEQTDGTVLDVSYTFAIELTVEGGATAWKEVEAKIIVCGSETLSQVEDNTYSSTVDIDAAANATDVDLSALFASDDPFCPAISYALKTNDTDFDTATDPTADELLNFNSTDGTMSLFPQEEGVYDFYIYAISQSGAQVTKPATLTVQCVSTSQVITLVDTSGNNFLVETVKNQDPEVASLLTFSELDALFSLSDPDRCLITSFVVQLEDGNNVTDTDSLYTYLELVNRTQVTDDIEILTTIDGQDGTVINLNTTFKVVAEASGGASAEVMIDSSIIVCGYETLELVDEAIPNKVFDFYLTAGDSATEVSYTVKQNFTSNDTDCPANTFSLWVDDGSGGYTAQDTTT